VSAPLEDPRVVEGLRAQGAERDRLLDEGARRLGWKAGFGTAAAMQALDTRAPIVGFLTDRTLLPDGATCVVADWDNPTLEPEVAVRLVRDLEPGADRATAAAAIDAIALAIELVDPRQTADVEAILAGNIFHRGVVLGEFSTDVPLEGLRLDVSDAQGPKAEGADPTEALGDLADVVRHLADQIPGAGTRLQAGDVVITGSAVPAFKVAPGQRFEVRASGLRPVSVVLG
jgi:2-keto-4-pentenoate hydratase